MIEHHIERASIVSYCIRKKIVTCSQGFVSSLRSQHHKAFTNINAKLAKGNTQSIREHIRAFCDALFASCLCNVLVSRATPLPPPGERSLSQ